MLSRRHIRIKIFQALYAYFKGSVSDIAKGEKSLIESTERIHELFLLQLSVLIELKHYAEKVIEERKLKKLPTEQDLKPNEKFVNNKLLNQLESNQFITRKISEYRINWVDHQEFIKKIFQKICSTDAFKDYMESADDSYEADKAIIIRLFKNQIADHEILQHIFEEQNIHWSDDHYFVCGYVVNTLKDFKESHNESHTLPSLYKDKKDDLDFLKTLYRQVLVNNDEYQAIVMSKAQNWEADRIAIVDFILMKMAICELEKMSSIPIKVTLNEYIEISKLYSTPKSRVFINGVLDKLVIEFKDEGKINKRGRGLLN